MTQVKQSDTPVKVSSKDKKAAGPVPSESGFHPIGAGVSSKKTASKLQKHSKLRLKNTQSIAQTGSNLTTQTVISAKQASLDNSNLKSYETRLSEQQTQVQALPRFEMKQISSRNQEKERQTHSIGFMPEPAELLQSEGDLRFQSQGTTLGRKKESSDQFQDVEVQVEDIGEEYPSRKTEDKLFQLGSQPGHKKSASYSQAQMHQPGLFNIYMGQVNHLRRQQIAMQKHALPNNTQPVCQINLGQELSHQLLPSHQAVESMQKSSLLHHSNS